MSIQEYAAGAIEEAAEQLINAAMALPAEKREWRPLGKGRTALSQIAECAVINEMSAQVLDGGEWKTDLPVMSGREVAALDTFDKAVSAFYRGTAHLVQTVRNTPDSEIDREIALPWASMMLAELFLMPLWNMTYHEGQITYIQTLLT